MAIYNDRQAARALLQQVRRQEKYDIRQFQMLHMYRNAYNVGPIMYLRKMSSGRFSDNNGRLWEEASTLKNWFHMPALSYVTTNLGITVPYSRKFLSPDDISGLDGEFEMIIRHDGKRIDALTHEGFQETYNFGRTADTAMHKLLDVDPHWANPNYAWQRNMGSVEIIEAAPNERESILDEPPKQR